MVQHEAVPVLGRADLLQWPIVDVGAKEPSSDGEFIYARPFLTVLQDLDLDFEQSRKSELTSFVLAGCLQTKNGCGFTPAEIWSWSLKKRSQGLLAVVAATIGRQLKLKVQCMGATCREILELELDPATLGDNRPTDMISIRPEEGTELQVRLPTGNDQLCWEQTDNLASERVFSEMAARLVVKINGHSPPADWIVPESWLEKIGADLEQHDPLMTIQLKTICPFCNENFEVDLDLEDKLLSVLAAEQKRMFNEVHRLASVYHWPEKEIIRLPRKRRAYYLACILEGSSE